jgi:chemotaxis protein CheY-P-specific phosphatase CheC
MQSLGKHILISAFYKTWKNVLDFMIKNSTPIKCRTSKYCKKNEHEFTHLNHTANYDITNLRLVSEGGQREQNGLSSFSCELIFVK